MIYLKYNNDETCYNTINNILTKFLNKMNDQILTRKFIFLGGESFFFLFFSAGSHPETRKLYLSVADERAPHSPLPVFHSPVPTSLPLPLKTAGCSSVNCEEVAPRPRPERRRRRCRGSRPMGGFATSRPASVALCAFLIFLNLFAFLLAVGAERRRSTVRALSPRSPSPSAFPPRPAVRPYL